MTCAIREEGAMGAGERLISLDLIPRLAFGVMDMQDFDRLITHAIENPVQITPERHDAHAFTLGGGGTALWPMADPREYVAKASFHAESDVRIVQVQPFADAAQVVPRRRRQDDLHLPRNLAKAASTSSSVANRRCSASRKPRSMPSSSSADGW